MHEDRKQRLAEFVAWAAENIEGDEKGDAQIFLDRLFAAFGRNGVNDAGAKLEMRVDQEKASCRFGTRTWKRFVRLVNLWCASTEACAAGDGGLHPGGVRGGPRPACSAGEHVLLASALDAKPLSLTKLLHRARERAGVRGAGVRGREMALNLDVAARLDAGQSVTAPGIPPCYPDPKRLVTEDYIRAE
jgi:hypothetical protein